MSPRVADPPVNVNSAPRVSGDEPESLMANVLKIPCSPRERG